jgi:hypothetical protein
MTGLPNCDHSNTGSARQDASQHLFCQHDKDCNMARFDRLKVLNTFLDDGLTAALKRPD